MQTTDLDQIAGSREAQIGVDGDKAGHPLPDAAPAPIQTIDRTASSYCVSAIAAIC